MFFPFFLKIEWFALLTPTGSTPLWKFALDREGPEMGILRKHRKFTVLDRDQQVSFKIQDLPHILGIVDYGLDLPLSTFF